MANVSQQIQSYLGGISQEPDYNKAPGMLSDIINGYPDITYGLRKRPGLRYEFQLDESSNIPESQWFAVANPGGFPYFGVIIPNDKIRLWNAATRQELTTTSTFDYLKINDKGAFFPLTKDSYKLTAIQNVTVILNRNCQVDPTVDVTPGTLTGTVTTYADLAELTPSDGDIYEIVNTPTRDEDNYYVKWNGNAWEECAKPGIKLGIDSSTMPHILAIDPATQTFSLVEGDNIDRKAGDDTTNPMPSFVGTYINSVFFYLNRVGYLSKDNIFLSQPLTPDNVNITVIQKPNYFNSSAIAISAADPVDVNCATIRPVELINALPAYNGLAIFSQNEQFVLYSEQGVVTPQTAIVKSISNYEMNESVDAIEVGESFMFTSKTQRNTRVWQLQMQGIDRDPMLMDVGKIITDYIPNTVDTLVSNPQNQFISLSATDDNKMYMYRRHTEQQNVLFQAWFRWDLPGKIKICAFFDDRMFITMDCGGQIIVASAALNLVPEEDLLTNQPFPDGGTPGSGEGIGPYIDCWISDGTPEKFTITYTEVTRKDGTKYAKDVTFNFPTTYPSQVTGLEPCVVKSKGALTRTTDIFVGYSPKVTIQADGTWVLTGNYELSDLNGWVAGWRYNYDLYLPTTFFRTETGADTQAFLKIDRYRFDFAAASEVTFKVKALAVNDLYSDADDWIEYKPVPAAIANYYASNTLPYANSVSFDLPIHRRNTYFSCRVFDNSPFPCTLSRMMWEGYYNPRFYRRN